MEMFCLERSQPDFPKRYDCIPLSQTNEVSIGRSNFVSVQILSKDDPLMLSRKHAIISYLKDIDKWVILDNKSLNGIYINDSRILPMKQCEIKEGDYVYFGQPSQAKNPTDFIYKFIKKQLSSAEVEKINSRLNPASKPKSLSLGDKRKWGPSQSGDGNTDPNLNSGIINESPSTSEKVETFKKAKLKAEEEKQAAEQKAKEAEERLKVMEALILKEKETLKAQYKEELKVKESKLLQELQAERERLESEKKELEEQMNEKFNVEMKEKESCLLERLKAQHTQLMNEKTKIQSKLEKEMEEKLSEKEQNILQLEKNMQEKLEKEIQEKEEEMMQEHMRQKENLLKEKATVEEELKKEWQKKLEEKDLNQHTAQEEMRIGLETKMKEKEKQMLEELTVQKEKLLAEKKMVEENLQKEMERKLDEKNKDLQSKLEEEKLKLETVITNKQREFETLQTELVESKREQENQKLYLEMAKQETYEKVSDVMESELQCSICAELLIQATTLNCSHSFCHLCIMEWFKKKKECPICRNKVTTYTHSLVLDNYIDKMVESFSEDLKTRRTAIVKERKSKAPAPTTIVPKSETVDISDDEEAPTNEIRNRGRRRIITNIQFQNAYGTDSRFNRQDVFRFCRNANGQHIVMGTDGVYNPTERCTRCFQLGHAVVKCPRTLRRWR
ncbi:uncharacterized protein [Antedon mediterranea]|uniref:uncharacterized protein isoform X2 n=1 Tax=Antedon mediterranea TaxID=105859 RepID=UPI003AF954C2